MLGDIISDSRRLSPESARCASITRSRCVLRLAGLLLLPWDLQHWDRTNPELPAVEEPLPLTWWKEVIAALVRGDADHPLPAVD